MPVYLRTLQERIRQSLWLVPAVAIFLAVAAAWLAMWLEAVESPPWADWPFIYRNNAQASLTLLSTITSSLITVAGVTFSITIVALTLASSQFGPRLLRNFLRSFPSQVTFGALTGSFVYGLLIMQSVDTRWTEGVPHPSITMMMLATCICVALLVFYLHHVATSIQADSLIATVHDELQQRIDALPPREPPQSDPLPPEPSSATVWARSPRSGYVVALDCDNLSAWATSQATQVVMLRRAGQFVVRGELLAHATGVDGKALGDIVDRHCYINAKRSPEQDLEFLVDQLVELALRAISPGINDPNTARICIDYLAAGLCQLADRALPPACWNDAKGLPRLWVPNTGFKGIVDEACDQLRQYGADHADIIIRLAGALGTIANSMEPDDVRRAAVAVQLQQLEEAERDRKRGAKDTADVQRALVRARCCIQNGEPALTSIR